MISMRSNNTYYIHYGSTKFSQERWVDIKNQNWIKPKGGLWASRVNSSYGWKEWNDTSNYAPCIITNSFTFRIRGCSPILVINSLNVLRELYEQGKAKFMFNDVYVLDFEKLKEEYDAIDFRLSECPSLYHAMYGWDCDSTLILNRYCMIFD